MEPADPNKEAFEKAKSRKRIYQIAPLVIGLVIIVSMLTLDFTGSFTNGDITGMSVATTGIDTPNPNADKQCKTDLDCEEGKTCFHSGSIGVCIRATS